MVLVDSHRISRAPWYSGYYYDLNSYLYKAITSYGSSFQMIPVQINSRHCSPTTPTMPEHYRFGLFRVRSPLLTESLLFSFPSVTEMFHFAECCFDVLFYSYTNNRVWPLLGFPIRKSPDKVIAPPRSLSQLITSFIASRSLGIRPALLITFLSIISI